MYQLEMAVFDKHTWKRNGEEKNHHKKTTAQSFHTWGIKSWCYVSISVPSQYATALSDRLTKETLC